VKWVDDFGIFRFPSSGGLQPDRSFIPYSYPYDLISIKTSIASLHIPWHPNKGQDFDFTFSYHGFHWNIRNHSVTLTDRKRLKFKSRVDTFIDNYKDQCVPLKEVLSIGGSLSHITFVFTYARSYLLSIFNFSSRFTNEWMPRYPPPSMFSDLAHWLSILSVPYVRSLPPRPPTTNLGIWVDASLGWGIGIIIDSAWDAWHCLVGWRGPGRDIGWLEGVAVELVLLALKHMGLCDADILIRSDNQGIIGAFSKGQGRNFMVNNSICRTDLLLLDRSLSLSFLYVESANNLADPISRGEMGSAELRFPLPIVLPEELSTFLVHA
jgi:hypothetical protein